MEKEEGKQSISEVIEHLSNENRILKNKIKSILKEREDFHAHKIYENARKKLSLFIGFIILALTGFGIISINTLTNKIAISIEEKGTENIIRKIKDDFIESNQKSITEATIKNMQTYIERRVEDGVKEEIQKRFEKVINKTSIDDQLNLVQAIEESYKDEKYIVIAASSINPKTLESLILEKKEEIGNDFEVFFPNARIKAPIKGNLYYGLTLGENLTFKEAKSIRERAIKFGFSNQTYLKLEKTNK